MLCISDVQRLLNKQHSSTFLIIIRDEKEGKTFMIKYNSNNYHLATTHKSRVLIQALAAQSVTEKITHINISLGLGLGSLSRFDLLCGGSSSSLARCWACASCCKKLVCLRE